jgi:1-phosphatidylinositol phosphodiesterase
MHKPVTRICLALAVLVVGCSEPEPATGEPDWMADLDDSKTIAELSIPGTHDSGARFDLAEGLAKCQDLTIADQLAAGVRFFDLRCRHVGDQFLIYHGSVDQNQTFDEVLATIYAFLDAHPNEVILASVKEEATPTQNTRSFEATFQSYIAQAPARWTLAPTLPRLGDVRGTLVLLRRFNATASPPLGIDATQWADNATFTISNTDAHLHIEDEYVVTNNDLKWTAATNLLDEAAAGDPSTWMLTYTSGYQMIAGLPNITIVSDDINARFDAYIADPAHAHAHLGTLAMDFVTAARVEAIVATNRP